MTVVKSGLKYGRRSPKKTPALRLASILTGTLPAVPNHVDYGTKFTDWQMLGNDVAGDCVAVAWANQRALVTAALTNSVDYPTQSQVWAFYRTQNPQFNPNGTAESNGPGSAADNGMDIQTALEYAVHSGGPDGVRAVAFAAVDFTNESELRAAHAIFGQVWYGNNVLEANDAEYWNDQPWDYVAGSPVRGAHAVTGVGYDPADYRFITWAQETRWTENYRTHEVEEAWVVIWPENLGSKQFQQGINATQLAADYLAITGRTLALPVAVQNNWKWCNKCQTLTYAGHPATGPCSAGGSHSHNGSAQYDLTLKYTVGAHEQSNWRWCRKCEALSYAGEPIVGACPGGGSHSHLGSGSYVLAMNVPVPQGQRNWRWCRKCQVLAFAGEPILGRCAAGGNHDHTGSADYGIRFTAS